MSYGGLWVGSKGNAAIAASTTLYGLLGDAQMSTAAIVTAEADAQVPVRTTGYFMRLAVNLYVNDRTGGTIKFRKGGADGTMVIALTGTGVLIDTTHTDSVTPGDLINVQINSGSGGTVGPTYRVCETVFVATNLTMKYGGGAQAASHTSASTTEFQTIVSQWTNDNTETEANQRVKIKTAGTWRNLWIRVSSSTRGTTTNVRNRINAGYGTMICAITAGLTGNIEDTTHSDSVSVDDFLAMAVDLSTGGGGVTVSAYASEFQSTTAGQLVGAVSAPALLGSPATSNYAWGGLPADTSTESNIYCDMQQTATLSNLSGWVKANDVNANPSVIITSRKNGSAGAQTISLTNSQTGYFEDTTHTDSVVSGDLVNMRFAVQSGGSQVRLSNLSVLYSPSSITPPAGTIHHKVIGG